MPSEDASESPIELLLRQVHDALEQPSDIWVNSSSDFAAGEFSTLFADRLKLHWMLTESQMTKSPFEVAFVRTLRDVGETVTRTKNPVHPGADISWNRHGVSLKTEAGRQIREDKLHISKFSEARFIRDCQDGSDFAEATRELFVRHLKDYDRILVLRSWWVDREELDYSLVEIPHAVLSHATSLTPEDFSKPTAKSGSSKATVRSVEGKGIFDVRLDGSVEKVTITNLSLQSCVVHARWRIAAPTNGG